MLELSASRCSFGVDYQFVLCVSRSMSEAAFLQCCWLVLCGSVKPHHIARWKRTCRCQRVCQQHPVSLHVSASPAAHLHVPTLFSDQSRCLSFNCTQLAAFRAETRKCEFVVQGELATMGVAERRMAPHGNGGWHPTGMEMWLLV